MVGTLQNGGALGPAGHDGTVRRGRDVAGVPGEVHGGDAHVLPVLGAEARERAGDEGGLSRRASCSRRSWSASPPSVVPSAFSFKETFSLRILIQLVAAPVDDVGHHRRRLELSRHAGTAPCRLRVGVGGPEQDVAALCGRGQCVGHGVQLEGPVLERVQRRGGQRRQLVGPGRRVRGVGLADVLVVEQDLIDVGRADDLTRGGGHRPRHLQQILEPADVDGEDAVDALACAGLPHAGRQRAIDVELGGQAQVAEVGSGEEPAPPGLEITADRHFPGGRVREEVGVQSERWQLAVAQGDDPGLLERARARPHFGVVAGEEQVGLGSLQNGGGRRCGFRRTGQRRS